jgi:hypothetical protein
VVGRLRLSVDHAGRSRPPGKVPPREGIVEGRVSETGTVTLTITRPGLAPVTFTGTAGPDVMTLVGAANVHDVDRPWTLVRN